MSDANITPFSFGNQAVRAVAVNGETWFVAKDVVEAVEAVWKGAQTVVHIPEQWKGVTSVVTPSGTQEMLTLSEHGVYFYLSRSDKPKALPIQMWIAGEVLPSIRRTGAYSLKQTPKQRLDAIQAMLDEIRETEARVTKLESAVENLGGNETHRTIKAHAAIEGFRISTADSKLLGARAKNLSGQRGYVITSQPDPIYGKVNSYHRDILDVIFKGWKGTTQRSKDD